MNRLHFKTAAATLLPAVATMLFIQACGVSDDATAQQTADPIEGVWDAEVTVRNCSTEAIISTFRGVNMMHRGGTVSDTNSAAPATRGPGFGHWSRNADGSYAVKFRFYRYNADGSLAGVSVVSSVRTLQADGGAYEGVTRAEFRDLNGAVLQTVCVTDVGTRFR
jgi:hypothetical protein